jgi:hypothetical protein
MHQIFSRAAIIFHLLIDYHAGVEGWSKVIVSACNGHHQVLSTPRIISSITIVMSY